MICDMKEDTKYILKLRVGNDGTAFCLKYILWGFNVYVKETTAIHLRFIKYNDLSKRLI